MSKPLPFDPEVVGEFAIILTRKDGLTDIVGQAIEWGQWGLDCRSPELVHAAVTVVRNGELVAFEAGFKTPQFTPLSAYDWDRDVLFRLKDAYAKKITPAQLRAARNWCEEQPKCQRYGYPNLLHVAKLGLEGHVGDWLGLPIRRMNLEEFRKKNPVLNYSSEICSQLVDTLFLKLLHLDILPNVGEGYAVPGDMSTSQAHYLAWGALGDESGKP
jgi:hypothetical protein